MFFLFFLTLCWSPSKPLAVMRGNGVKKKPLSTDEKLIILGVLHYLVAIFLMVITFAPFNIPLSSLLLTEQTYTLLLADTIIMGTILYALGMSKKN